MAESNTSFADAWSRYWASGVLHSCPNAFAGNYSDEIRDHWLRFFSRLPDGARVLDIGTGNGAVAYLARDAATSMGFTFRIEGIDAAVIQPAAAANRHGIAGTDIVFRGGTSCEQTGYPDRSFDAASSQYAIEYSDVDATLAELARILKPGALAGFILHHADSEAIAVTRAELKAFEFLRREAPLVATARRLLRPLKALHSPSELAARLQGADAQKQLKALDRLLKRVSEYARSRPHAAFLGAIAAQVAAALKETRTAGPAAALHRLDVLETEMGAHRERLRAIAAAGRTREEIEAFCASAARAGFEVESPLELRRAGSDLVGWVVHAARAGA